MLDTITKWLDITKWFRPTVRHTAPARFVYDPPWSDWVDVISQVRKAEDAVLAYAQRADLPAGVRWSFDMAVEQIKAGRLHGLAAPCAACRSTPRTTGRAAHTWPTRLHSASRPQRRPDHSGGARLDPEPTPWPSGQDPKPKKERGAHE